MNEYKNYYLRPPWLKLFYISMGWLAFLSKLMPKRNGLFLFGSMNGYAAVDNSIYLYLNINEDCQKFFITKNRAILGQSLEDGSYPIFAYSLKGISLQFIAQRVYYTHGIYDFVPFLIWGSEKHNLWHGVAIKEVGPPADWIQNNKVIRQFKVTFHRLFAYAYYMSCDYVYCPFSERTSDYLRYFEVSKPKIIISMQPRNKYAPLQRKEKKILYAPTYRPYCPDNTTYLSYLKGIGLFGEGLETLLKDLSCKLVIRAHPIDRQILKSISLPTYLELDETPDVYQTIKKYVAVVTDYSSIYYDCAELGTDCYILAPDLERYKVTVGMDNCFYQKALLNNASSLMEIMDKLRTSSLNK